MPFPAMRIGLVHTGVAEFLGATSSTIEELRVVVMTINDVHNELPTECLDSQTWRLSELFRCDCASRKARCPRFASQIGMKHPASCSLCGIRLGDESHRYITSRCRRTINKRERGLLSKATEVLNGVIACLNPEGQPALPNHIAVLRTNSPQRALLRVEAVLRAMRHVLSSLDPSSKCPRTCNGFLEFDYRPQPNKLCGATHTYSSAHEKLLTVLAPLTVLRERLWIHLILGISYGTGVPASHGIVDRRLATPPLAVVDEMDVAVVPAVPPAQVDELPEEQEVVQLVVHAEPPAQIHEHEAIEFVAVQEADFVERLLTLPTDVHIDDRTDSDDKLLFLKLNRNPKDLRQTLCEGLPLKQCREALEVAGHDWMLVGGALFFVHPQQFREAVRASMQLALRPDIIVFAESLEHLLEETMATVLTSGQPQNRRIWAKDRMHIGECDGSAMATVDSQSDRAGQEVASAPDLIESFVVTRTFLCTLRRLRATETVIQSSTETDPRHGVNPRRAMADDDELS